MNPGWIEQSRNKIFLFLLGVTVVGMSVFYLSQPSAEPIEIVALNLTPTSEPSPTLVPSPTPGQVRVYVTGAVVNVDVYYLPAGSIIKDAIQAAGGLTAEADRERINLALELKDQQQIHVPHLNEEEPPPPVQGGEDDSGTLFVPNSLAPTTNTGLININVATLEELDTLPGIGPAIGRRIIDYREQIGGFNSIEAITEVSGIGEATFAKIEALITVD
jgi:competence protein ComEA